MGLIEEPMNVDFSNKSKQWTEKELADFRKLIQENKAKNKKQDFRLKKTATATKA